MPSPYKRIASTSQLAATVSPDGKDVDVPLSLSEVLNPSGPMLVNLVLDCVVLYETIVEIQGRDAKSLRSLDVSGVVAVVTVQHGNFLVNGHFIEKVLSASIWGILDGYECHIALQMPI